MKELIRFIRKEKHKELLEVFLIIDEVAKQRRRKDCIECKVDQRQAETALFENQRNKGADCHATKGYKGADFAV